MAHHTPGQLNWTLVGLVHWQMSSLHCLAAATNCQCSWALVNMCRHFISPAPLITLMIGTDDDHARTVLLTVVPKTAKGPLPRTQAALAWQIQYHSMKCNIFQRLCPFGPGAPSVWALPLLSQVTETATTEAVATWQNHRITEDAMAVKQQEQQ